MSRASSSLTGSSSLPVLPVVEASPSLRLVSEVAAACNAAAMSESAARHTAVCSCCQEEEMSPVDTADKAHRSWQRQGLTAALRLKDSPRNYCDRLRPDPDAAPIGYFVQEEHITNSTCGAPYKAHHPIPQRSGTMTISQVFSHQSSLNKARRRVSSTGSVSLTQVLLSFMRTSIHKEIHTDSMSSLNFSLDWSDAPGVLMPLPWLLLTVVDIMAQTDQSKRVVCLAQMLSVAVLIDTKGFTAPDLCQYK